MKLYDPFGVIAGTWHFLQSHDGDSTVGGYVLMAGVIAAHVVVALLMLALVVHLVGAFREGLRTGYQRSRGKA